MFLRYHVKKRRLKIKASKASAYTQIGNKMKWLTEKFSQLQGMLTTGKGTSQKETTDFSSLRVVELKAIAKEKNLKGYNKMRKAELVDALSNLS
jgi:hypothetical protein